MSDENCNIGTFAFFAGNYLHNTDACPSVLRAKSPFQAAWVLGSTLAQHANPEYRPRMQAQNTGPVYSLSPVEGPQRKKRALKLIYSPTIIETGGTSLHPAAMCTGFR